VSDIATIKRRTAREDDSISTPTQKARPSPGGMKAPSPSLAFRSGSAASKSGQGRDRTADTWIFRQAGKPQPFGVFFGVHGILQPNRTLASRCTQLQN
jgi:hypothetical protein